MPHELVGEEVDARYTVSTVELLHKGKRVAAHARSFKPGKYTTVLEHMPKAHQKHLQWTPSRIIDWARETGPKTAERAATIMRERRHPEEGYRSCLGILRLGKTYGPESATSNATDERCFAPGLRRSRWPIRVFTMAEIRSVDLGAEVGELDGSTWAR